MKAALIFAITLMAGVIALPAHSSPIVGWTKASVDRVELGVPTQIIVTSEITDPLLIPESVTLQRVNSGGSLTAIGLLRDDGMGGDEYPGDSIFSLGIIVNEITEGLSTYQVSAAFRGQLRRLASESFTIYAMKLQTAEQMLSQLAGELESGDINAALMHYEQNDENRAMLEGYTLEARKYMAKAFREAKLVNATETTRVYSIVITRPSTGFTATTKIGVARAITGEWFIMF